MAQREVGSRRISRSIRIYGLPVAAFSLMAWLMTTSPPSIVVLWAILMLFPPLLGIARQQGYIDALRWAKDRADQENRL